MDGCDADTIWLGGKNGTLRFCSCLHLGALFFFLFFLFVQTHVEQLH